MLFNLLSTPGEADRITEGVHQHRRPCAFLLWTNWDTLACLVDFSHLTKGQDLQYTGRIRHRKGDSAALLFSTFVIMFWARQSFGRLGRLQLSRPGIHRTCLLRDGVR